MSKVEIDLKRRRFLTQTTIAVGGVGSAFATWPFLASWTPSARARASGAPIDVDISKITQGQLIRILWRRKPVLVFRRDEGALSNLKTLDTYLADPNSDQLGQQPTYARNFHRSIRPEIGVMVGICTHLSCSPTYRPEIGVADLGGESWKGGFYCPCHGSKFDLSGRVYSGVPAPTNLVVPPYSFITENTIRIGVDPREEG